MTITDTGISSNDWVLFNINETGYYRVNYDSKNWNMLIDYLNDKDMYMKIGKCRIKYISKYMEIFFKFLL